MCTAAAAGIILLGGHPTVHVLQEDVPGAVAFAKGEVKRLLLGQCNVAELVMTGGLWRITGKQVSPVPQLTSAACPAGMA